jgi:hypothetical protein
MKGTDGNLARLPGGYRVSKARAYIKKFPNGDVVCYIVMVTSQTSSSLALPLISFTQQPRS